MPRVFDLRLPLATLAALLALSACDSGGPSPDDLAAAYVFNQGQFGNDNSGTITTWDPTQGQARRLDPPGGLPQGGLVSGGRLYALLNFSDSFTTGRGLINEIDLTTGTPVRQFEVGTPRGIAIVDGTAYVSDLYGGGVTPIDLATGAVGEVIPTGENPEGVAASGGRVFVANSGFGFGSTLSVIEGGAVVETVDLGCAGPNDAVATDDGEVWVVCTGRSDFSTGEVVEPGEVVVVDAESLEVAGSFTFAGETLGGAALGQDAAFDADRDELYVLQTAAGVETADTIYRFSTRRRGIEAELSLPTEDASGIGFGGGQLYVGRLNALNPFSDDGFVSVHDRDGEEIVRFDAGVAPAAFAFAEAE